MLSMFTEISIVTIKSLLITRYRIFTTQFLRGYTLVEAKGKSNLTPVAIFIVINKKEKPYGFSFKIQGCGKLIYLPRSKALRKRIYFLFP